MKNEVRSPSKGQSATKESLDQFYMSKGNSPLPTGVQNSTSDLGKGESRNNLEGMKKSGMFLGGYQSMNAHASLIIPGPAPQIDPSQFFSPQNKKGRSIIDHEYDLDGPGSAKRAHNFLRSAAQPVPEGVQGMQLGRNNSIYLTHARNSMFSPITHRPMHVNADNANLTGKGAATQRAASMTYQPTKQSEPRALAQNQQNGINFTKTSLQARAEGQIKPKAYNAWDLLALNDLIKGKIEDQNRKTREHNQRLEMRRFYDNQVEEKRR